jgi:putative salt-induced outer membrane protein
MKVNGNLASKIAYTIKSNSDVPAGTEKTDKITSITLVYSF